MPDNVRLANSREQNAGAMEANSGRKTTRELIEEVEAAAVGQVAAGIVMYPNRRFAGFRSIVWSDDGDRLERLEQLMRAGELPVATLILSGGVDGQLKSHMIIRPEYVGNGTLVRDADTRAIVDFVQQTRAQFSSGLALIKPSKKTV